MTEDFLEDLMTAIRNKDIQEAKELLAEGADLSKASGLVYMAYINRCNEMVKVLLEHGAPIYDAGWSNPIHLAMHAHDDDYAPFRPYITHLTQEQKDNLLFGIGHDANLLAYEDLLANGANLEARNSIGYTPLQHAIFQDKHEKVKILLDHNANPNALKLYDSQSCVGMAVAMQRTKILKYLLEANADITTPDKDNIYPLTFAARLYKDNELRMLLKHAKQHDIQLNLEQALINAITHENENHIKLLCQHGVNLNQVIYKKTPFIFAVEQSNDKLVELLAELGADPRLPDEAGKTPIMYARNKEQANKISRLITIYEQKELDEMCKNKSNDLNIL